MMLNMRNTIELMCRGMLITKMNKDTEILTAKICKTMSSLNSAFYSIGHDFFDAISSCDTSPAHLPPLPFHSMVIDIDSKKGDSVLSLISDEFSIDFHGFCVVESVRGSMWDVAALVFTVKIGESEKGKVQGMLSYIGYKITNDRDSVIVVDEGGVGSYIRSKELRSWVVEMVHIITAKNVDSIPESRQIRRNLSRKMGIDRINSFTINMHNYIHNAGNAASSRVYHCRWIVRGHWREYKKSGKKTWVDPYIKGPPGMPWRNPNKPIYMRGSE